MIFAKNNNLNFAVVVKLLGMLLLIEAAFMLPSAIVSFAYHETAAMWSFIYSIAITVGAGALGFLLPVRNHDMGRREGFLLTSLTWVVFSFFGMLPFIFDPCGLPVPDAFFETMSGLTTTGASTMESVENQSHGILLWRAVTHFIGGMGIILFTLAVIPMLNKQSGLQLFNRRGDRSDTRENPSTHQQHRENPVDNLHRAQHHLDHTAMGRADEPV